MSYKRHFKGEAADLISGFLGNFDGHYTESSMAANAYELSKSTPAGAFVPFTITDYYHNMRIKFTVVTAGVAGATTLQISTWGATTLQYQNGTTSITEDDLKAGNVIEAVYSITAGAFIIDTIQTVFETDYSRENGEVFRFGDLYIGRDEEEQELVVSANSDLSTPLIQIAATGVITVTSLAAGSVTATGTGDFSDVETSGLIADSITAPIIDMPRVVQSGAAVDLTAANHHSKKVIFTNTGDVTATVTEEIDCLWKYEGTGTLTFAAGAGMTVDSHLGYLEATGQNASGAIIKDGTDQVIITGDLSP